MSDDPRISEIYSRLGRPESVEVVRAALLDLDGLLNEPDPKHHVATLIERAFGCLRELTAAEPEEASRVLIDDLLPRCLMPDEEGDGQRLPRYDKLFGEWLEELSEDYRDRIRQIALPRAIAALDGIGVRNALRLIGSIGYWDDDLLRQLDQLITLRDDESGDHALSVRAWLTPTSDPAPWLLEDLHRRMGRGPSLHPLVAARAIGTPDTAAVIWVQWLTPRLRPSADPRTDTLFDFTLSLLAQIAARSGDGALSERVWSWLLLLVQAMPERIENDLALNSGLAPRLNVAGVVPELLRRAGRSIGFNRSRYYARLLECAQPAHMAGWPNLGPADLDQARADATKPTGMTGRYATVELDQKEAAWEVLLCRGDRSALPPFAEALAGEASGHVIERFLNLAGCLALPSLPGEVTDLLAAAPARESWSEKERLIAQIGAIRAAHGAASREAFGALLGYRQVGPGVLLSLVDALAETAMILLESGDRAPVCQLVKAAEEAPREDSRGAAAAAVALLLERGHLTQEEVVRIAALTSAAATDPYARLQLLFAFATCPPGEVPASLLGYASDLLDKPPADKNRDPRPAALALLARQIDPRSDTAFMTRRLGLLVHDGKVTASPSALGGVIPHIVGRHFVVDPQRFGPAVGAILSEGGSAALSQLLVSVREAGSESPAMVIDAIVARLRKADSGRTAEPALVHALAIIAPDRLLTDGCSGTDAWLPQARTDLADTLGRIPDLPDALAGSRFDLLVKLAGDGIYAVRRAAYRAAAGCAPDRLADLILSWAQWRKMGREGPRRRAAECAGWLPQEVADSLRELGGDQEPSVRDAYARSMEERDERVISREYEERVLSVQTPGDVVCAWRYGMALSQVGDDSTLYRLADRLGHDLPPPVRFWLSRIRKAVERRWRAVTSKWPEPWFARPGSLEEFAGCIRVEGGEIPVAGMLWLIPAELPGGLTSWGGWAKSEGWINAGEGELLIPSCHPARVVITSAHIPAGDLVFSGSGPYPDPIL